MSQNCWEIKKCGRGPNSSGKGVSICPTAMAVEHNGINHGVNGGRYCWIVKGTYCEGYPQDDTNYKEINCALCRVFQQVRTEEGENFEDGRAAIIDEGREIKKIIKKGVLDSEPIEVQIDNQPRIYYTQFLDNIPPLQEITDNDGMSTTIEPDYEAGSYVDTGSRVLIFPLTPALGNALIRRSENVVLRFYRGVKAIESNVEFQGIAQTRQEVGLALSFPMKLKEYRQRRFCRFAFPQDVITKIVLSSDNREQRAQACFDASLGGLGCKIANRDDFFAINDYIKIHLSCYEYETDLTVNGYVRWIDGGFKTREGKIGAARCGLQFDIKDTATEKQVQALIGHLQRSYLCRVREARDAQTRGIGVARESGRQEMIQSFTRSKPGYFEKLFGSSDS